MSQALIRYEEARNAIAHARTIDELKEIRDKAEAVRAYSKQAGLSLDIQNDAAEIRLRAERRAGALLRDMDRQRQGRPEKRLQAETFSAPPTLEELGIEKTQSHRWQRQAAVPEEDFERWVAQTRTAGGEITGTGLHRLATVVARDARMADTPPPAAGTYRVIYADPPWHYQQQVEGYGHTDKHYSTLTTPEIEGLELPDTTKDAVCFLWTTSPKIEEGLSVLRAWGFTYKAMFVWDKVRHNYGHYNSVRHELLLIGTRGSCTPDVPTLFDSVQEVERSPEHSRKPERFREIIDTLYPPRDGLTDRVELFRRGDAPARWDVWGAEADA